MKRERLVKKIYQADVESSRRSGRPRRRMDEAKGCLSVRMLIIQKAKECIKDRRKWKRIVERRCR